MFDSWRQQQQALRKLPRYQLDEAFAFRVMRESLKDDQAIATANSRSQWKTGIAAIAALAALLLLTVFVFPRLASRNEVAEGPTWEEMQTENSVANENASSPDQPNADTQGGSMDTNLVALGNPGEQVGMSADANQALRPGERLANNQNTPPTSASGTSNPARPGSNRKSPPVPTPIGISTATGDSSNDSSADSNGETELASSNKTAAPDNSEAMAAEPNSPARLTDTKQPSVDRVLLINMQHREQALAELQRVFARNSIQIVNPNRPPAELASSDSPNRSPGQPEAIRSGVSNDNSSSLFSIRSQSGIEAVYVVSTPAQMRKAITELADQALIAGYSVPEDSPAAEKQQPEDDGSKNANASAQQLEPWEFGNNQNGGYQFRDGQELLKTEKPVNGNADNEIAELDKWFNLSAENPDSDLIHFLLFVRTADPKSNGETPTDPASEESSPGQIDK